MFPSLIVVRTARKRVVSWTWKSSVSVGTSMNCHILANHPTLADTVVVLGPDAGRKGPNSGTVPGAASRIFPAHRYSTNGLTVSLLPLGRLAAALLLLCALSLVPALYFSVGSRSSDVAVRAQDWSAIPLPAAGVYGLCRQDRSHGEGVRFVFHADGHRSRRLEFTPGGEGGGSFLTLLLNGTRITDPISLPEGWGKKLSMPLPAGALREGRNILEIRPGGPGKSTVRWGIREVRVVLWDPEGRGQVPSPPKATAIRKALDRTDLTGSELALYYSHVTSPEAPDLYGDARDVLKQLLEMRMLEAIKRAVFERKSRLSLGAGISEMALRDPQEWIPLNWPEGWELYDELRR